jgi:hypothetical protein
MVATYRSATSKLGIWVIDSDASHNYCNNIKNFQKDSVTESKMLIKLGDNNTVLANKKGFVRLNGVDIRPNPTMMLEYVHNTTKIWRVWDFNSGMTGRAVECSSVVFDEKEDAFTSSTGERSEVIEFPEEPQESHEVEEMNVERMDDSLGVQNNSKLITQKSILFPFATSIWNCRAKEEAPVHAYEMMAER